MGSDTLVARSARAPQRIMRSLARGKTLSISPAQPQDMTCEVAPQGGLAGVMRGCSRSSRFRAQDSTGRDARVRPSCEHRARRHRAWSCVFTNWRSVLASKGFSTRTLSIRPRNSRAPAVNAPPVTKMRCRIRSGIRRFSSA